VHLADMFFVLIVVSSRYCYCTIY